MRELLLILSLVLPPSFHPIVVQQNNQIIDCQQQGNPVIVGNGTGIGITVQGKTGVVIQNCTIKGFDLGLLVADSSNIIVRNSNFSDNHVDDNSILDLGAYLPKGGVMFNNVSHSVIQNVTAGGNVQG